MTLGPASMLPGFKEKGDMEPEELKPFVEFMEKHHLLILSVQKEGFNLYLVKEGAEKLPFFISSEPGIPEEGRPSLVPSRTPREAELKKPDNVVVVTSPLVGTFYRSPAPGAPPFVEVGSEVKPGDTLCIVEAMKVMNEVKSETSGRVLQIKAEDGKLVEFGQVLFLLEKT